MVRRPSLPMSGGCVCGRHRYTITVLPLTVYACHCADCQTQSGSAFGMSMPVARSGFRVTGAEDLGTHLRAAASGRTVAGRFCTTCGTRIFHEPSRNPPIVNVKPGTLDDTSWLEPMGHLWVDSAQRWVAPADGTLIYPGQPPAFDDLYRRFAAAMAARPPEPRAPSAGRMRGAPPAPGT
ncbi:MAG: GFA family protein [Rhodospirillaceae bacterium]|nr:GFA family protein [Rhodospirillaceae bacterium]MCA8933617.1 GFA family protein [Rhodospirillaceae bacterium]